MDIGIDRDESGRIVCTVRHAGRTVAVTAADLHAAAVDLAAALEDARADGYGECFWPDALGEYRWMFRRHGAVLTVVALRSSGTLTGWEHVLQGDVDFETFDRQVREGLAILGASQDV